MKLETLKVWYVRGNFKSFEVAVAFRDEREKMKQEWKAKKRRGRLPVSGKEWGLYQGKKDPFIGFKKGSNMSSFAF